MMERISAKDYRALVAKPPAEPRDIKPPKKARKRAVPIKGTTSSKEPPSRSEEHTSELQSLMRISYAVFCLKKKKKKAEIFENRKASMSFKTVALELESPQTRTTTPTARTHQATPKPQT